MRSSFDVRRWITLRTVCLVGIAYEAISWIVGVIQIAHYQPPPPRFVTKDIKRSLVIVGVVVAAVLLTALVAVIKNKRWGTWLGLSYFAFLVAMELAWLAVVATMPSFTSNPEMYPEWRDAFNLTMLVLLAVYLRQSKLGAGRTAPHEQA